jgi:hypothetical protein
MLLVLATGMALNALGDITYKLLSIENKDAGPAGSQPNLENEKAESSHSLLAQVGRACHESWY